MKGWILYRDDANSLKPESHEVSRFRAVAEAEGIELRVLRPEQFDLTVTREDRRSVVVDGETVELPDFVLPRMGAGTTYFALAVIRHLERLGVFVVNSSTAVETARDKLYTHQILAEANLPVPKTMLMKFPVDVDLIEKHLGFPVVVKPLAGSQGGGVFLAESRAALGDLMQLVESTNAKANIIVQEFIEQSRGRDLRVLTLGGRVIACMERRSVDTGFKANYSRGGEVREVEVTPEIEWLATQTASLLNLDLAGVDLLYAGDHLKVCEANSSPGFEGLESCCHVDVPHQVFHFVRVRQGLFRRPEAPALVKAAGDGVACPAGSSGDDPGLSDEAPRALKPAEGS